MSPSARQTSARASEPSTSSMQETSAPQASSPNRLSGGLESTIDATLPSRSSLIGAVVRSRLVSHLLLAVWRRSAAISSGSPGSGIQGSFSGSSSYRGTTWMWKWNTVCQAAAPQALIRLIPSAPRTPFIRPARRCEASTVADRSSAAISSRSAECSRGTTSACPGVAGLMSMKATVRSSESIVWLGIDAGDDAAEQAVGVRHARRPTLSEATASGYARAACARGR